MKISLIDNGLDSLRKGYVHLEKYEALLNKQASDEERFSALKDSVLSIQHGVEILFKFSLKEKNELLLFTDISKLKEAYKSRRDGAIQELYEFEGLHTVTFKESIERLRDICGVTMSEKLVKNLKKVEGWRNNITHSAVLLRETEVANVLIKFLAELDEFFSPLIGPPYLEGQGRTELDRAYRLTKAAYGELQNKIKALTVERLIVALQLNGIKNVSDSSSFIVKEPLKALSILKQMQGDEIRYGCDFINLHCSGHAEVENLTSDNILTINAIDTQTQYQFCFDALVIYIPKINNDKSPLIFMYAKSISPLGAKPYLKDDIGHSLQCGIKLIGDESCLWDRASYEQAKLDYNSNNPSLPPHKEVIRFLSGGPTCFMNVQGLDYGSAHRILDEQKISSPDALHLAFQELSE
ncbi:hypothetical protein ACYU03_03845 [Pseudomonas sp. X10]